MRRSLAVKWTRTAERDLFAIVEFVARESPGQALDVFERIRAKAAALTNLPDRGRVVPELNDQGIRVYRELVLAPWRMIHRVADSAVYVLAVLDGRRNLEDILLDRFIGYTR